MNMRTYVAVMATTLAALVVGVSVASANPSGGGGSGPTPKVATAHGLSLKQARAITTSTSEAHYVPVKNCRIVNTAAAGGKIRSGHTRSFYVVGTAHFPGQSGTSGGCGIPAGATAVSARLTAVNASANGAFVAYPTGTPTGQGTLYYGKGVNVTTGANLQIASGTGKVLTVKNVAGPANLAIDVNGYFVPPIEGLVYTGSTTTPGSGFVYSGSPRLLSVTWISTGIADVTVDRDVTYCTPMAGGYYDNTYYANAKAFNSNKIRVYTWYLDPTTHVATRVNNYVYLTVSC